MTVSVLLGACSIMVAQGAICPADPTTDLCDTGGKGSIVAGKWVASNSSTNGTNTTDESSFGMRRAGGSLMAITLACGLGGKDGRSHLLAPLMLSSLMVPGEAAPSTDVEARHLASSMHQTCVDVKKVYKDHQCCGSPTKSIHAQTVPFPTKTGNKIFGTNICANKKPPKLSVDLGAGAVDVDAKNKDCLKAGVVQALEQAGADVTKSKQGSLDVSGRKPRKQAYHDGSKSMPHMCPVNVHWHVGAEHRSEGQYDEKGKSPKKAGTPADKASYAGGRRLNASERSLANKERYGYACMHYDANKPMFTKAYAWQHCIGMHVGETYEIHWPHSALGACNTPHQYQTPFYDGVFCNYAPGGAHKGLTPQQVINHIGVQAQVFTIVNDETYYYPNLMKGMIVQGDFGKDLGVYTGSTTGTSRSNTMCSSFAPITWQVDRKCHMISASSFDKMCADMKQVNDDMSADLHPHGARELVEPKLAANNLDNMVGSG